MNLEKYEFKLDDQETHFGDTCEIKCVKCGKWFPSSIKYATAESFIDNSIAYNKPRCPKCRRRINVSKNNKRYGYRRQVDGRIVYIEGIEI